MLICGLGANTLAVLRLRVWNPSRTMADPRKETAETATRAATREIWDNPIIWREICTRAYGRKTIFIKLAYLVVFAFAAAYVFRAQQAGGDLVLGMISPSGFGFVMAGLVSLLLVNAQAVTALTTERPCVPSS